MMVRQLLMFTDKAAISDNSNQIAGAEEVVRRTYFQGVPPEDTEEKYLFEQIAQGDEKAFRKLFHLYGPLFNSIIRNVTKNDAVVADLLQDVFLKLWLKRDCLGQIKQPRRWALQIVYHQSFNWLKHQKVKQKHVSRLEGEYVRDQPSENEIESHVFHQETYRMLNTAIADLPPQTQKVYRLNREEGLRIAEIAEELHLSTQTVKNTLGRAIRSIRQKLEQNGIVVSLLLFCLLG